MNAIAVLEMLVGIPELLSSAKAEGLYTTEAVIFWKWCSPDSQYGTVLLRGQKAEDNVLISCVSSSSFCVFLESALPALFTSVSLN